MTMTRDKIEEAVHDLVKLWDSQHVGEDDFNEEMCRIEAIFREFALAERALEPQTPMDVTVYTLERLRGAMTRFGISCGEGGMEHFSVKFESHLLEFIRAATDSLDKLRQAYADLEAAKSALEPQGQALPVADGVHWDQFPAYLIDKCEGSTIYEESMQQWLADMLKDPDYMRIAAERASQLVLPAGPVPEELTDDELNDLVRAACFDKLLLQADGSYIIAPHELRSLLSDFAPSPAVTQPVAPIGYADQRYLKEKQRCTITKEKHHDGQTPVYSAEGIEQLGFKSAMTSVAQPVAEVDQHHFVQPVPDHCDRITWRNRYYHIPLNDGAQPVADEDSKRINWLEANNQVVGYAPSGDWAVFSNNYGVAGVMYYGKTWRAAVDAARAALCQPAEEGDKA